MERTELIALVKSMKLPYKEDHVSAPDGSEYDPVFIFSKRNYENGELYPYLRISWHEGGLMYSRYWGECKYIPDSILKRYLEELAI